MLAPINRDIEAELVSEIDPDRIESHVEKMAGLHRYPDTDDQWEAAEYIVETLSADGVDAEIETLDAYVSVPESASVTMTRPVRKEFESITIAFSASTPPHGISEELIHVESVDPDTTDLSGVADRIVFSRGLPTPAAMEALEAHGAAGAVFQSPSEEHIHEMTMSPIWGTPSVNDQDRLPDFPVAQLSHADGEWLADRLAGDTVEVTIATEVRTERRELPCPIAKIDGTESDRYFIVGNHIDSWHEGVTDNGTAVAASMELARIFAENPPKRGVLVGFWPGHSMGRYAGSARYADENWLDLHENGIAYLHLDLNGLDGADHLWYQHMAEVADEHLDVLGGDYSSLSVGADEQDEDNLLGSTDRPGRNSDQSFWGAGLTSLLSGARFSPGHEDGGPIGGGWWWHTPADTIDKVDFDLLEEETQLYAAIVSRFCNSAVLPHDFRATAGEIRTVIEEIDEAADGAVEFSPVYDRLDTLDERLDAFTKVVGNVEDGRVASEIEDVQVRLGNLLIPALYMESQEYEHDPAMPHQVLPYLRIAEDLPNRQGPRELFAQVSVDRGISKLAHRIDEATRTVEQFVESQPD